ncbi:MAG TPA: hypothetical protein VN213_20215 [Solirubrobacteraceae bacterium]|nr:hypothetical protein [Solirubrobacteraceae bacterium]
MTTNSPCALVGGERLAWRGRMYDVELTDEAIEVSERVALNELKRVVRLRLLVDADDIEPCIVVTHRRAACAAEQVE